MHYVKIGNLLPCSSMEGLEFGDIGPHPIVGLLSLLFIMLARGSSSVLAKLDAHSSSLEFQNSHVE